MAKDTSTVDDKTRGPFGLTRWQTRLALFCVWTSLGLLEAVREYIVFNLDQGAAYEWRHTITWGLTDWYLWGLLSILIVRITRVIGFERRLWPWNILMHLGLAVVFGAVQIWLDVIGFRMSVGILFTDHVGELMAFQDNYVYFLKTMGHTAIIVYFLIALGGYAVNYFRQYRDAELDKARVQAQLAQAQLESLKTRLHPHFLFNALNSISALIHSDGERADRMIARLSELLRTSIESTGVQELRLEDEIDFLSKYLELQKMRFEDRLNVDIDVDQSVRHCAVPFLILQPLVENSIRHGVAKVSTPIHISIRAYSENGRLRLSVSDDGPGFESSTVSDKSGFGIQSTKERLLQLYGDNHRFRLTSQPGQGTIVVLEWPLRGTGQMRDGGNPL